jgi:PKD repeat protein
MTPPARPRLGHLSKLLAPAFILLSFSLLAQDTITIGTGVLTNSFGTYPAPYGNQFEGSRHQMLVLADELLAAGMSEGDIVGLGFEVQDASFIEFAGFTVSLGMTGQTSLTTTWVGGLVPVFGPTSYINGTSGWTEHLFDIPFTWDGTSNLVVQTCFRNDEAGFNAVHLQTATSFESTLFRATTNPNVCTGTGVSEATVAQRPNMRFYWNSFQVPPIAAFTQSTTATCDGSVQFTDLSEFQPDGWLWDFGDVVTDTVQNPEHQYQADGVYIPVLIVTNAFGSDTIEGQPITVNISGPQPVDACVPTSSGTVAGFGLLSITLGGLTVASDDAVTEGYADRTCQGTTVLAGTNLDIALTTGSVATHNVRVWIDWDNSGDYIGTELVLTANSVFTASATVAVPAFAVQDIPLRVRYMADYDFSPLPDPCTGPQFGQAEDYALTVLPNTNPPEAGFSAIPTLSCDGSVQFADLSINAPSSWQWDFGDTGTSDEQSPLHTYSASGTYDVRLIVSNANGADTLLQAGLVTVDLSAALVPAACQPETQQACCGFGLMSVLFAGIDVTSPDGTEGYADRSCGNVAQVTEGMSYPVSIGTGGILNHDVIFWMDLDNNGSLDDDEKVWSALDQQDPSATFVMPGGTVFGTPLRLRISADVVGETTSACDPPLYGQMEDFTVIVTENTDPPIAAFSAAPTTTCNGYVQFTDASTNAPDSWLWDFGDTGTSAEQSPLHQYTAPGDYTVSLTVTSTNGTDTQTNTDFIHFVAPWVCDTLVVPDFQPVLVETCPGILSDDGGPEGPYLPFDSESITIAPTGADLVTLTFSQFQWGNNDNRWLAIYDGPDTFSPLIGQYTGNGLGQLPNNGVVSSTGNSITLRQESQGGGGPQNSAGFLLTWTCGFVGMNEIRTMAIANVWPQPASEELNIMFGTEAPAGSRMELHDAVGALVVAEPVSPASRTHRMDVAGLAKGPYVLSLVTATGRWNRAVMIN